MNPTMLKNWTLATVLMAASALSQAQGPAVTTHHKHAVAATRQAPVSEHHAAKKQPTAKHAAAKKAAPHAKAHGRHPIATSSKSAKARHGTKAVKAKAGTAHHPRRAHKAAKVQARQHRPAVH